MTVFDVPARARRDRHHVRQAIAVLNATALGQPPAVLGRATGPLERRRSWPTVRLATPDRSAATRPRNLREPTSLRPGQPPPYTATPA